MDNDKIVQNLLEAIDTIASQRVSEISFDKTVKCTIINTSQAALGQYTVSDGSSTFLAYAETADYIVDTVVNVLIPNGDYSQQKTIIGKYISQSDSSIYSASVFDNFVDFTGNIIDSDEYNTTYSLIANGDKLCGNGQTKAIFKTTNDLNGYTTLGIKGLFKSLLKGNTTGEYGIAVSITGYEKEKTIISNIVYMLSSNDMLGDSYNFMNYFEQEALFDISNFQSINDIEVYLYENEDFDNIDAPADNIFLMNPYVSLGHLANEFKDNQILLYSTTNTKYNGTLNSERSIDDLNVENTKIIQLKWIHKTLDNNYICIDNSNKDDFDLKIHWYLYDETYNDISIAGNHWLEVYPEKDDSNLIYTNELSENIFTLLKSKNDVNNDFESIFIPNYIIPTYQLKTVIEFPQFESFENQVLNNESYSAIKLLKQCLDDNDINKFNTFVMKCEQFSYFKSAAAVTQKELDLEDEWYNNSEDIKIISNFYKQIIQQCSGSNINYYESSILTFASYEEKVEKVEQEDSLVFLIDNEGKFNLYDEDNYIINSGESLKLRILSVYYNKDDKIYISPKVIWKIPLIDTMIAEPSVENGDLYNIEDKIYTLIPADIIKNNIFTGNENNYIKTTDKNIESNIKLNTKTYYILQNGNYLIATYYNEDLIYYENSPKYINNQNVYYYDGTNYVIANGTKINDNLNYYYATTCKNIIFGNETLEIEYSDVPCGKDFYFTQYFHIKDFYLPTNINNTIECELYLNGVGLNKKQLLSFYGASSSGTQYSFTIETNKALFDINTDDSIKLKPHLYDENGNEIEITLDDLSWDWYSNCDKSQNNINFTIDTNGDISINTNIADKKLCCYDENGKIKNYNDLDSLNNAIDKYQEKILEQEEIINQYGTDLSKLSNADIKKIITAYGKKTKYEYASKLYNSLPDIYTYVSSYTNIINYLSADINDKYLFTLYKVNKNSILNNNINNIFTEVNIYGNKDIIDEFFKNNNKDIFYLKTNEEKEDAKGYLAYLDDNLIYSFDTDGYITISKKDIYNKDFFSYLYYIFEFKYKYNNINFKTTYPIFIYDSSKYLKVYFSGCTNVNYSSSGIISQTYNGPYKLSNNSNESINCRWELSMGADWNGIDFSIDENNVLQPYNIYLQDLGTQLAVIAYEGTVPIFSAPIKINQSGYKMSLINAWNGKYNVDEDNGTILATMLGAGKKDSNNLFEGVLMGDVGTADTSASIGLYGYNEGVQSFGFRSNGTAFIGKSGRGQIKFDGNSGLIENGTYGSSLGGMQIDLDDGVINIKGPLNSDDKQASILIQPKSPYFKIVNVNGETVIEVTTDTTTIGDYTFEDGYLKGNTVGMGSNTDYAFWAGGKTADVAPYWIKKDGTAKIASNWYIGKTYLSYEGESNVLTFNKNGEEEDINTIFKIKNNFGITSNGTVYATGAKMAGDIYVDDLYIKDNYGTGYDELELQTMYIPVSFNVVSQNTTSYVVKNGVNTVSDNLLRLLREIIPTYNNGNSLNGDDIYAVLVFSNTTTGKNAYTKAMGTSGLTGAAGMNTDWISLSGDALEETSLITGEEYQYIEEGSINTSYSVQIDEIKEIQVWTSKESQNIKASSVGSKYEQISTFYSQVGDHFQTKDTANAYIAVKGDHIPETDVYLAGEGAKYDVLTGEYVSAQAAPVLPSGVISVDTLQNAIRQFFSDYSDTYYQGYDASSGSGIGPNGWSCGPTASRIYYYILNLGEWPNAGLAYSSFDYGETFWSEHGFAIISTNDDSNLQTGDVIVSNNHTMIYVGAGEGQDLFHSIPYGGPQYTSYAISYIYGNSGNDYHVWRYNG